MKLSFLHDTNYTFYLLSNQYIHMIVKFLLCINVLFITFMTGRFGTNLGSNMMSNTTCTFASSGASHYPFATGGTTASESAPRRPRIHWR